MLRNPEVLATIQDIIDDNDVWTWSMRVRLVDPHH